MFVGDGADDILDVVVCLGLLHGGLADGVFDDAVVLILFSLSHPIFLLHLSQNYPNTIVTCRIANIIL